MSLHALQIIPAAPQGSGASKLSEMTSDTPADAPTKSGKGSKRQRLRSLLRSSKDDSKEISAAPQPAHFTEVTQRLDSTSPLSYRTAAPSTPDKPAGVLEWIDQLPPSEFFPKVDPRASQDLPSQALKSSQALAPSKALMAPLAPQTNSASQVFTGRECFTMLQQCYGIREADKVGGRGAAVFDVLIDFKYLAKNGVSTETFARSFGAMVPELVISKLFTKLELIISAPGTDGKLLVRPILRANDPTLYNHTKPDNPLHQKWLEPEIVGEYMSEALGVQDGAMVRGNIRLTSSISTPQWQAAKLPLQTDTNLSLDGKLDMAFWLKASWFPHDMVLIKEHMFVNKYGETCPYLHVVVDDLGPTAYGHVRERYVKSKIAMKSAMHLYNRWMLRVKTLNAKTLASQVKGDEKGRDDLRQYAISIAHDAFIIYSFSPRVRDNKWRGCEMASVQQGKLGVEAELKGFITEFDRIQQWGETVFLEGIAKDLDRCIENGSSN